MSLFSVSTEDLEKLDELESRCTPSAGRPARSYPLGRWQTGKKIFTKEHVVFAAKKAGRTMSKREIDTALHKVDASSEKEQSDPCRKHSDRRFVAGASSRV